MRAANETLQRLSSAIEEGRGAEAEPYTAQTQQQRETHVRGGGAERTAAREVQCLQAERRERREAAENSDHDECTCIAAERRAAVRGHECREQANGE